MLLTPDLCVIGGGSAGLSVAAGAARLGVSVVLVDAGIAADGPLAGVMGGDCLHTGCVPSKALLAVAAQAAAVRAAAGPAIQAGPPRIDFSAVMERVRAAQATIAPHDSVERFTALGVTVLPGTARFESARDVIVTARQGGGLTVVRARRVVIATGSQPRLPPVPGLDQVPVLTSTTVFTLTELPRHLGVFGGGPQGVELAQAFRRLGAEVTLITGGALLPKEDADLVTCVRHRLLEEGIVLREGGALRRADPSGTAIRLTLEDDTSLTVSHLLAATGRSPHTAGLGLAEAGVAFGAEGIWVGRGFRTSNRRVYAVGDVAAPHGQPGPRLTHLAGWQAGQVIRAILFRLPGGVRGPVPRAVWTDPELAWVGLTESAARARYGTGVRVVTAGFDGNDRAVTEGQTDGLCKLVLIRRRLLPGWRLAGAGVVGHRAGDLLPVLTLAVQGRLSLTALAGQILPYPSRSEVVRAAAAAAVGPAVFSAPVRSVVRLLRGLP
ncbi:dihydrolipoyl dehydrogenase family protein [Novispirillum itersonii]|uniref:Pyruvate/2-oxoglutarate dehydrogenase complex dihydrolipoamide dehydrogenase (E3) component n=1 Tax=Novispirillum itersonii TaxID=189 RepID=A0A7X0DNK5_NOVIT|nr:NAD(P)/FAD-dependent oxidoreductase [Novispirillum itersonii]MBB6211474.1 pyruvate/2-oxoglutarate dehydrogenase complex dihydrolipoamide dehydrogenase (E3) component [Novispirillum itersonii]